MTALPSSLALTTIADGALEVAIDHRNNYAAIQTAVNQLIAALSGGSVGQVLKALTSTSVDWSGGAFTDYTPTLTATSVNPNLGASGAATGRYTQIGKLVICQGKIIFSGAGVAAGTGDYRIALPVAARSGGPADFVGKLLGFHGSAIQEAAGVLASTTTVAGDYPATWPAGNLTPMGAAAPWAWGANDFILFNFAYEAA